MVGRVFANSDGEMLLVPQEGRLRVATELGCMEVEPLQIALVPRGISFRIDPIDGAARGYVCENYGGLFKLPDLGPIGSYPSDPMNPYTLVDAWAPTDSSTLELVHPPRDDRIRSG